MSWDFWNNPIVVSAFRVRYRRSSPTISLIVVVLALTIIGVILEYNARHAPAAWRIPWHRYYLVWILAIISGLSAFSSLTATASSIQSEVANRTLDFQRIAALSPKSILLGKLLGEPAMSYFYLLSSIPLAVFCVLLGSSNLLTVLLIYLSLFTTTLLAGAIGLIHTFELPANKASGSSNNGSATVLIVICSILPSLFLGGSALYQSPGGRAILGVLTPVIPIFSLLNDDPWKFTLDLYHFSLPLLLVTPFSQTAMVLAIFSMMARRLTNTAETLVTKPQAYIVLLLMNLFIAAVIAAYKPVAGIFQSDVAMIYFLMVNSLVSVLLIYFSTPSKEAISSWTWGLKNARRDWLGWWLGNRSPNLLATFTIALIGPIGLVCFFLIPTSGFKIDEFLGRDLVYDSAQRLVLPRADLSSDRQDAGAFHPISVLSPAIGINLMISHFLSVLMLGWLIQFFALMSTRLGAIALAGMGFAGISVITLLIGTYYHNSFALMMSPIIHLGAYQGLMRSADIDFLAIFVTPCWVSLATVALFALAGVNRRIQKMRRIANAKLIQMGVAPNGEPASGQ